MYEQVLPNLWMLLSHEERNHLAEVFDVKKTGVSEVRDNQLISDGYRFEDLAVITREKMAEYVGSEDTFPRLWELTCAKAQFELNPPVGQIGKASPEEVIETNTSTNVKKNK